MLIIGHARLLACAISAPSTDEPGMISRPAFNDLFRRGDARLEDFDARVVNDDGGHPLRQFVMAPCGYVGRGRRRWFEAAMLRRLVIGGRMLLVIVVELSASMAAAGDSRPNRFHNSATMATRRRRIALRRIWRCCHAY